MAPNETAPVLPGETLAGKYRVERVLGKGGMGIVVAARHLELDERVAIKFLLRSGDAAAVGRFVREARAAVKVKSEHVCRVFDVGRLETGEPYLVMEYLDGIDLAGKVAKEGPLPVALVAGWMIEACAALAEAHALGIVHRDLKPANLFLATRGAETLVKILDFGISKLPMNEGMTSTTATLGSPGYMSPEQVASARDVDGRTDIWSLGVTMHELVTGRPPFVADSLIQLSVKIRESEPPAPSSVTAGVTKAFDQIVAKCLAKKPASRFASVRDLAAALAPLAGADSARLADRISRDRTLASKQATNATNAALAPTEPGLRGAEPSPVLGQVTLEPLSRASAAERTSRGRWPRLAAAVVIVAITAGIVVRIARTEEQNAPIVAADAPAAPVSLDLLAPPLVPAVDASAPLVVTVASAVPSSPRSDASAPTARTSVPRLQAVVDGAVPLVTPPTARPTEPLVGPAITDPTARKKRPLDRSDPYAP